MTVFVSYCHHDAAVAQDLTDRLVMANIKVWRDEMRIREGDQLEDSIFEAIRASRLFVVLVSRNSTESEWVRRETELAVELEHNDRLDVVPVMLDVGAELSNLRDRRYLDGSAGVESIVGRLVERAVAAASPPAAGQRVSDDARHFTHHNRQMGRDQNNRAVIQLDIVSFDLDAPYSVLTQFTFHSIEPIEDLSDEDSRELADRVMRACAASFDDNEWRVKLRRDETENLTFQVIDPRSGLNFKVVGRTLRLGKVDRGTVIFNVGALFTFILPDDEFD
jgi:TIR domain